MATAAVVSWRGVRPGAVLPTASWQVLLLLSRYVVGHLLRHSSALYGVFGSSFGLLAWLYLQFQVTPYAVEVCTVRKWRVRRGAWPCRSPSRTSAPAGALDVPSAALLPNRA